MTSTQRNLGILIGLMVGVSAAYLAAMGPLDPPAGPVIETSPSLSDLDSKLDQLLSSHGGVMAPSGPWDIVRVPETGTSVDNPAGTLFVDGPVYVHAIVCHRSYVVIFDGMGSIDSDTYTPVTSNWIGRSNHVWFSENSQGKGQLGTQVTPIEQVASEGIGAAWNSRSEDSFFYILYKPLPSAGDSE